MNENLSLLLEVLGDRLLTVNEIACDMLCSKFSVYRYLRVLLASGEVKKIRIGKKSLYCTADVYNFLYDKFVGKKLKRITFVSPR